MVMAIDEESPSVNVRPTPGKLFMLSGVPESNQAGPVTVTLASDMGREISICNTSGTLALMVKLVVASSGSRPPAAI